MICADLFRKCIDELRGHDDRVSAIRNDLPKNASSHEAKQTEPEIRTIFHKHPPTDKQEPACRMGTLRAGHENGLRSEIRSGAGKEAKMRENGAVRLRRYPVHSIGLVR